jgi:hypothetical protein
MAEEMIAVDAFKCRQCVYEIRGGDDLITARTQLRSHMAEDVPDVSPYAHTLVIGSPLRMSSGGAVPRG